MNDFHLLLDTSFFLPTIGIAVQNQEIIKVLKQLHDLDDQIQLYYTPFSLLELSWIALKLKRNGKWKEHSEKLFLLGLRSIQERYNSLEPHPMAFLNAIKMKELGHPDLIDCLLFSLATWNQIHFLTLDTALIDFLNNLNLDLTYLMPVKKFFGEIKR